MRKMALFVPISVFSVVGLSVRELCVIQSDHITIAVKLSLHMRRELLPGGKKYPYF